MGRSIPHLGVASASTRGARGRSANAVALTLLFLLVRAGDAQGQPNPILRAIPNNTALDLGEYTCTSPAGEPTYRCVAITDYSGFVYDHHRHQMLMFGGGHATTMRDDVDVFDFHTLTWNSAYESTPCWEMMELNFDSTRARWITSGHPTSRHTYDLMAVTEGTGEFLLMRGGGNAGGSCARFDMLGGEVAHYDVDARTWSFSGQTCYWDRFSAAEVDPVSGNVILRSSYGLYVYDPVARTALTADSHVMQMAYACQLVYFPPNDRMYYIQWGSPTQVWEITLDRANWSNSTTVLVNLTSGDVPDSQEAGWAYDSWNGLIGGGVKDGIFYAYDPIARHWTSKVMQADSPTGTAIGTVAFHALDFDPVDGVFIFITDSASDRHTWAYRYDGAPGQVDKVFPAQPRHR